MTSPLQDSLCVYHLVQAEFEAGLGTHLSKDGKHIYASLVGLKQVVPSTDKVQDLPCLPGHLDSDACLLLTTECLHAEGHSPGRETPAPGLNAIPRGCGDL